MALFRTIVIALTALGCSFANQAEACPIIYNIKAELDKISHKGIVFRGKVIRGFMRCRVTASRQAG